MTHTYTPGGTGDKDRIRLRIGDTNTSALANQRLEDEEIADIVTQEGSLAAACARSAEALAAKFATLAVEKKVGATNLIWRRFEQLMALAADIRARAGLEAVPFAGGLTVSGKATLDADTDRVQPHFKRGMLDHPGAED